MYPFSFMVTYINSKIILHTSTHKCIFTCIIFTIMVSDIILKCNIIIVHVHVNMSSGV